MPRPGKVPLKKLTVTIPVDLYREVEAIVSVGKRWISEVDFIRHAVANEVDRWRASGHHIPETPSPSDVGAKQERRTLR